jgi:hypothetical protein
LIQLNDGNPKRLFVLHNLMASEFEFELPESRSQHVLSTQWHKQHGVAWLDPSGMVHLLTTAGAQTAGPLSNLQLPEAALSVLGFLWTSCERDDALLVFHSSSCVVLVNPSLWKVVRSVSVPSALCRVDAASSTLVSAGGNSVSSFSFMENSHPVTLHCPHVVKFLSLLPSRHIVCASGSEVTMFSPGGTSGHLFI